MKKETLNIAMNITSVIAMTIAVVSYIVDIVDQAIYFMCLAIYLKEHN